MGAKCCSSEVAAAARREHTLESPCDGGVQVDVSESFQAGGGKPLWLIETEEAAAAPKPEPPLPPPLEVPPDDRRFSMDRRSSIDRRASGSEASAPMSEAASDEGKRRPRRSPEGKARARARARSKDQDRQSETSRPATPAEAPQEEQAVAAEAKPALAESPAASSSESPVQQAGGALHHVLRICLRGARSLPNADLAGSSDPYCSCEVPGKSSSKFKTKVVNNNLDPCWHHTVEMTGFAHGDSLAFSVFDKDTMSADDLLGKADLSKDQVLPMGFDGELQLLRGSGGKGKRGKDAGWLDLSVKVIRSYCVFGKVKPQVKEMTGQPVDTESPARTATITIYSAKGLRNADWGPGQGLSDPYTVCEIPGRPKTAIRTPTSPNTLNPRWDFTGQIPKYFVGDSLLFTVMDKDVVKADDFLGRATLDGDALMNGFFGELSLSSGGSIKVKVHMSEGAEGSVGQSVDEGQTSFAADDQKAEEPKQEQEAKETSKPQQEVSPEEVERLSALLLEAAGKGEVKNVRKWVSSGASLETLNADGLSALHIAVQKGHEEFVAKVLRQKGKRKLLGLKTPQKDTALHLAARDDQKNICAILVKEGANLKAKNSQGKTPSACATGQLAEWLEGDDPASTTPPWQT